MTLVPMDRDGLAAIASAVQRGDPVIIPFPTPLPYVVAAADAATVNKAKGRPAGQPCGVLLSGMDEIGGCLDLDDEAVRFATWITRVGLANLLLPIRPHAEGWIAAASSAGRIGVTLACLEPIRPLIDSLGHLFVSSGNRTGEPVATTSGAAQEMFDNEWLVLDGDRFRDPAVPHGSATMVEMRRSGALGVVRDGINNTGRTAADHAAYLAALRQGFRDADPAGETRGGR